MKKVIFIIATFAMSITTNAQQWNGNQNTTDHIYREGNVSIGTDRQLEKLTLEGNLRVLSYGSALSFGDHLESSTITFGNDLVIPKGGGFSVNIPLFEIHNYNNDLSQNPLPLGTPQPPFGLYIHPGFDRSNTLLGQVPDNRIALFISNNKNVGIGTNKFTDCSSCQGYRLFVKDGIKTEKVKVEIASTNGWADYVFKKDYQLMPLNDLQTFIDDNGHLPEVPTTEEAIANGIELKEMNILLLKKIEELTLYTLEQQKLLEKQGQEIKALQEQITSSK